MTSLDELLESERQAVDPSERDVARVQRRVMTAAGVTTAAVTTAATVHGGASVLSKVGGLMSTKVALGWTVAAVTAGGIATATVTWMNVPADETNSARAPAAPSVVEETEPAIRAPSENDSGVVDEPTKPDEPSVSPREETPEAAPSSESLPQRPTASVQPGSPSQAKEEAPSEKTRLRRDAQLLSRVTAALNEGRSRRALSLMNQARLEGSPLAAEFAAARAVALCNSGRRAEAERWVARFRKQAPQSPAARRVAHACGLDDSD